MPTDAPPFETSPGSPTASAPVAPDTKDRSDRPVAARASQPEIAEPLLDTDAVKTVRRLRKDGYKAYLVGGCVRDLLLGIRPKDFDVATSAHPNQVKQTFRNCRLIGRRFRLAHVFFRGGKIIEVSTFRSNPLDELTDLPADLLIRHDNVFGTEEEDARRRDFTINGLFYDLDSGTVVDHVGGKPDLARRQVRTIGTPDVRMREDPVRILRAIRFAAKCAFDIEPATLAAMKAHVHEIPRCAPPRVLEELLKLVRSGAARRCIELLHEIGALRVLLPPVAEHLERRGPDAAAQHLRALDALDAHVRVGEIPSDAVLLATLLAPLPREGAPRGPIPKGPPRPPGRARPASSIDGEEAAAASEADPSEVVPPAPLTGTGEAAVADALGAEAAADDDELDPDLEGLEAELLDDGPDDPAHEPLPEGALRAAEDLHDERLGTGGIPAFSVGAGDGTAQTWTLPEGIVPPELVLAELVRTARLPRRIAERTRLILAAQPILSGERKKKRASLTAFARQSIFPEALAVFELSVAASGKGADHLGRWQALFAGQDLSQLELEPEPPPRGRGGRAEGAAGPSAGAGGRPKRRRRGGRGRGRKAP